MVDNHCYNTKTQIYDKTIQMSQKQNILEKLIEEKYLWEICYVLFT